MTTQSEKQDKNDKIDNVVDILLDQRLILFNAQNKLDDVEDIIIDSLKTVEHLVHYECDYEYSDIKEKLEQSIDKVNECIDALKKDKECVEEY